MRMPWRYARAGNLARALHVYPAQGYTGSAGPIPGAVFKGTCIMNNQQQKQRRQQRRFVARSKGRAS